MSTVTLPAGQLAALDQAISRYRAACRAFAYMTGSGEEMRAAESALRATGRAGDLIMLPIAAVHFSDVRADGARMTAVNGSLLSGESWVCWQGGALRFGIETWSGDAWTTLVQVRA